MLSELIDHSSIQLLSVRARGFSPAPSVSTIHARIVRRAAAQWCDCNAAVLPAVRHRLAAGDTTSDAKAYGAAKAACAKRECAVAGDADEWDDP